MSQQYQADTLTVTSCLFLLHCSRLLLFAKVTNGPILNRNLPGEALIPNRHILDLTSGSIAALTISVERHTKCFKMLQADLRSTF